MDQIKSEKSGKGIIYWALFLIVINFFGYIKALDSMKLILLAILSLVPSIIVCSFWKYLLTTRPTREGVIRLIGWLLFFISTLFSSTMFRISAYDPFTRSRNVNLVDLPIQVLGPLILVIPAYYLQFRQKK